VGKESGIASKKIKDHYQRKRNLYFLFNTKDYKLPKGATFDYDAVTENESVPDKIKDKKGKLEIHYSADVINKGVNR